MSWREQAACLRCDNSMFFPERGEDTSEAKAVCATCPVKTDCLEHAVENRELFGIWGGTTERERRFIRRDRRIQAGGIVFTHWCAECGKKFESGSPTAVTCSIECKSARFYRFKVERDRRRIVA